MAVDPSANKAYQEANTVKFVPGSMIWVNRVQFTVVSSSGNTLILKPVSAKIS